MRQLRREFDALAVSGDEWLGAHSGRSKLGPGRFSGSVGVHDELGVAFTDSARCEDQLDLAGAYKELRQADDYPEAC